VSVLHDLDGRTLSEVGGILVIAVVTEMSRMPAERQRPERLLERQP